MTVMSEMSVLLKQAMTYAGAVGQVQGLIAFVKNNPEAYSHEQLLDELFKLSDAINDKLATVEAVGEQE